MTQRILEKLEAFVDMVEEELIGDGNSKHIVEVCDELRMAINQEREYDEE